MWQICRTRESKTKKSNDAFGRYLKCICAFNPVTLDSNPKHGIYDFNDLIDTTICQLMVKINRKLKKCKVSIILFSTNLTLFGQNCRESSSCLYAWVIR